MTIVGFALGQCCDEDLHPTPSFCARVVFYRRGLRRHTSTSGQPDADYDHVKGDGYDGRDLLIRENVSVRLSSSGSKA